MDEKIKELEKIVIKQQEEIERQRLGNISRCCRVSIQAWATV
ncbi:hypothetical protein ACFDDV_10700 [Enterococcus lactis]|nr:MULTISPECIES: hypothetical protein [Enterococcus]MDB7696670.1 hypothetical protein [Enterococcus faecium]